MAKIVERLKKKHRDSVWKDREGDLWFFSTQLDRWVALVCTGYEPGDGYEVSRSFKPDSYGPFTRAARTTFGL